MIKDIKYRLCLPFTLQMEEVHRKREAERASRVEDDDRDDAPPGTTSRPTGPLPPGLPPGNVLKYFAQ